MNNYTDEIRSRILAKEMFEFYGFHINRAGFCLSPFSREKTPSLKVYKGDKGWHCFSTGKGGDVIDFVQEYFNLDFKEAMAKLNEDFHLGLPIGEKRTDRQRIADAAEAWRKRQVKTAREKAIEQAKSAYYKAYDRWLILFTIKEKMRPNMDDFPGDGFWAAAVMLLPQAEYEFELAETRLYEAEHGLLQPENPV